MTNTEPGREEEALENLRQGRQLDSDGIEVAVSREAVNIVDAALTASQARVEELSAEVKACDARAARFDEQREKAKADLAASRARMAYLEGKVQGLEEGVEHWRGECARAEAEAKGLRADIDSARLESRHHLADRVEARQTIKAVNYINKTLDKALGDTTHELALEMDARRKAEAALAKAREELTEAKELNEKQECGHPAICYERDQGPEDADEVCLWCGQLGAAEQVAAYEKSQLESRLAAMEGVVEAFKRKRAVDGMNGRPWDALKHYDAEQEVASRLASLPAPAEQESVPRESGKPCLAHGDNCKVPECPYRFRESGKECENYYDLPCGECGPCKTAEQGEGR